MKFSADLRRRHLGFTIWMTIVFTALVLFSARIVYFVVTRDPANSNFDLRQEWSAVLLFAFPWIATVFFIRQYRRHRAQHARFEHTIADSLRASLDEIRLVLTRLKVISALLVLVALLLPLIAFQLRAVGKAGDEILLPVYVLFPLFVLIELCAFVGYNRWRVQPRKRQLETLLKAYTT